MFSDRWLYKLASLAFSLLGILFIYFIFRPVKLPFRFSRHDLPLFIYTDPSESMLLNGGLEQSRKLMNLIKSNFKVSGFWFPYDNHTSYTDLGEFLDEAISLARKSGSRVLVFLTDGRHNRGVLPHSVDFPIFFVLVGRNETGEASFFIKNVDYPPVVSRGESFSVKVECYSASTAKVVLKLVARGFPEVIKREKLLNKGFSKVVFSSLSLKAPPSTVYRMKVELLPASGHGSYENSCPSTVFKGYIRVSLEKPYVLVMGMVSQEFSSLVDFLSQEGYPNLPIAFLPDGRTYIGTSPADSSRVKSVLERFARFMKVVFLVDVPDNLMPEEVHSLASSLPSVRFVGEFSFRGIGEYRTGDFGQKWFFSRIFGNASGRDEIPSKFPQISSIVVPSEEFLSGKKVLVRVDGNPLMLSQAAPGAEVYFLTDSLWKVRLEDAYMGTDFYGDMIRTATKLLLLQNGSSDVVEVYPNPVNAGEGVRIRIYSIGGDLSLRGISPQAYFVEYSDESGVVPHRRWLDLTCYRGVCHGFFSPEKSGILYVKIGDKLLKKEIAVNAFNPERYEVSPTSEYLRKLDLAGGGIVVSYENFSVGRLKSFLNDLERRHAFYLPKIASLFLSLIFFSLAWLAKWLS